MACLIHGCWNRTRTSILVCDEHAVEIWSEVEVVKGTSASPIPRIPEIKRRVIPDSDQWVYFLKLDEKIKIGWTSNFSQRMKAYPPHAEVLVRRPGTRADERDLHRSFKPSRASGREWYHPTPELLAHIERLKAEEHAEMRAKAAAYEAERNSRPRAVPRGKPVKPRPLRGQALVRAILAGEVD